MSIWKKIRKSRIYSLIKILLLIVVCFIIGASAAFVNHESDPTDEALEYFESFIQEDYEKMYSMLEIPEDKYIDKDLYIQNMKKIRSNITIDTYEIIDPVEEEDTFVVSFSCINLANDTSQNFVVRLKEKREGLQIIPDYQVSIEHMMIDNLVIEIPTGFDLLLNGKSVVDAANVTSENKKDIYTISGLIGGTYTIEAAQGPKALVETVDVVKNDTLVKLKGNDYTASNKYGSQIKTASQNFITEFYEAVKSRNPEKKSLHKILGNDELKTQVSQLVLESQEIVYWPDIRTIADYNVSQLELSPFDISIVYNEKQNQYNVTYKYSYDYKAETSTTLYNSYIYVLTGTCTTSLNMTYDIVEDGVVLKDITMENDNVRKEDNSLRKPEQLD